MNWEMLVNQVINWLCINTNLKKYIEDKEDLDAEIPSDDEEEEKSDEKELKGLSKKERDLIKSIK